MALVYLRSVPESVGGDTQSLIVMLSCSFSLRQVVVQVLLPVPVPLTDAFDCANLKLALLSWVFVFIAEGSGSTE